MIVAYVAGGVLEGFYQMIVIASLSPMLTAITFEGHARRNPDICK